MVGPGEASSSAPRDPPTYDDATFAQRPSSSARDHSNHVDDNDPRQPFLDPGGSSSGPTPTSSMRGYRPPTVETPRSSEDTADFLSPESGSARSSLEGVRSQMVQMEISDENSHESSKRLRLRDQLSRRLTRFRRMVSSIRRRFPFRWPQFEFPRIPRPAGLHLLAPVAALVLLLAGTIFLMSVSLTIPKDRGVWGGKPSAELVRSFVQGHVDPDRIRRVLERITAFDHVAGTRGDYASAKYVRAHFENAQLEDVHLKEYQVYLNYPRAEGRRVAIVSPNELAWEAKLEEDMVFPDQVPPAAQTMVFHGHSRAGNVTGPLVYANYGSREDFQKLEQQKIDVKGSVVLVRYYGSELDRALKVKAAEMAGAVGCLIYSDPNEDGFKRGDVWPKGRWRPSDGVQRGAVSLMSWVVGDVLTPGYASTAEAERVSKENNPGLVNIPSLPLAWRDAQKLLQALKGHGDQLEGDWVGGVPEVVEWWTGDQNSPRVLLANEQDEEERQPIWNVMGKITGIEESEKAVIVGNHRDAWCFGGSDPGSGTAVLLEVVQIFSKLVEAGWRPLRTIQFASWDGEEYNLIGSTEWVEEHMDDLRRNGIAYLNLDTAVSGHRFQASASPVFQASLLRALDRTADPYSNETLRSIWERNQQQLKGLGAGSDYVAFQDMAGTSSFDMSFGSDDGDEGVLPVYHSCYDSFEWMNQFGDPGFVYHSVMAQIWALMILEMADRPVLPFDMEAYARAIGEYVTQLEKDIHRDNDTIDLSKLHEAANQFKLDSAQFAAWEHTWEETVQESSGGNEPTTLAIRRMSHNARMTNFETHLLDLGQEVITGDRSGGDDRKHDKRGDKRGDKRNDKKEEGGGIPGRTQFKHILYAPQIWNGYGAAYFPYVRDALHDKDWALVEKQIDRAAEVLKGASWKLLH